MCEGNDARLSNARTPLAHSHKKADISDFPTSMPASDVPAWAKATKKPTYTASEVGASPSNHNHDADYQPKGSYANLSHTHDASDITPDSTHRFVSDSEKVHGTVRLPGITTIPEYISLLVAMLHHHMVTVLVM